MSASPCLGRREPRAARWARPLPASRTRGEDPGPSTGCVSSPTGSVAGYGISLRATARGGQTWQGEHLMAGQKRARTSWLPAALRQGRLGLHRRFKTDMSGGGRSLTNAKRKGPVSESLQSIATGATGLTSTSPHAATSARERRATSTCSTSPRRCPDPAFAFAHSQTRATSRGCPACSPS